MKKLEGTLIKGPVWYSSYEAPLPVGRLYVAADLEGVVGVGVGLADVKAFLKRLSRGPTVRGPAGGLDLREDGRRFAVLFREFDRYFTGRPVSFSVDVKFHGTSFKEAVWGALRGIPRGSLRSYGEVASIIGRPKSARAVGGACAGNPLPIIIPCHRVIGADGRLGGYTGGVEIKRALLALEGVFFEEA